MSEIIATVSAILFKLSGSPATIYSHRIRYAMTIAESADTTT